MVKYFYAFICDYLSVAIMEPARGSLMSENEIAKLSAMDGTTATADSLESDFGSQNRKIVT